MIHFDEMACLLYLEGQLEDSRARELAAHAANARACRELLRSLERESKFLSGALTEEDESIPARLLGSQTRSCAVLGLVARLCGVCRERLLGVERWNRSLARSIEQCGIRRNEPDEHDAVQRGVLGRMG